MLSVLKNDFISFHRVSLPTETNLLHELKKDYPNGNMIFREDYQKSFQKEVWWRDKKSFFKVGSIGEVYPSYSNGSKIVMCDEQIIKMADAFDI